ncbi:YdeI/OmpD-associated family protein [Bowmanella denitrificans]|uniref:YdeI/OmpD-associated family protein n=1 Tax=Bowmanella denitrificans TaxID=366582 RepID=A0ABP3GJ46_9ALTE
MEQQNSLAKFQAKLRQAKTSDKEPWAFVVLPMAVSDILPRRGRTSVEGTVNNAPFTALLEPDGKKSHWLRIDQKLMQAAGVTMGDEAEFKVKPVEIEPEPEIPADLQAALISAPEAMATWQATTTLARVDWIHWITTAKQAKTRAKRISDACDMLASGKKRVCCFDPSGFYSKALSAPEAIPD